MRTMVLLVVKVLWRAISLCVVSTYIESCDYIRTPQALAVGDSADAGERVLVSLGGTAPSYEVYLKYLHGKLCWYRNGLSLFFKPEYWANLPTVF